MKKNCLAFVFMFLGSSVSFASSVDGDVTVLEESFDIIYLYHIVSGEDINTDMFFFNIGSSNVRYFSEIERNKVRRLFDFAEKYRREKNPFRKKELQSKGGEIIQEYKIPVGKYVGLRSIAQLRSYDFEKDQYKLKISTSYVVPKVGNEYALEFSPRAMECVIKADEKLAKELEDFISDKLSGRRIIETLLFYQPTGAKYRKASSYKKQRVVDLDFSGVKVYFPYKGDLREGGRRFIAILSPDDCKELQF